MANPTRPTPVRLSASLLARVDALVSASSTPLARANRSTVLRALVEAALPAAEEAAGIVAPKPGTRKGAKP